MSGVAGLAMRDRDRRGKAGMARRIGELPSLARRGVAGEVKRSPERYVAAKRGRQGRAETG